MKSFIFIYIDSFYINVINFIFIEKKKNKICIYSKFANCELKELKKKEKSLNAF